MEADIMKEEKKHSRMYICKIISRALLILCFMPLFPVFGENYKLTAYKIFGKSGEYTAKYLIAESISTDNPDTQNFRIDAEVIFGQFYGFSLGWITGKTNYTMKYNGSNYFPEDEKNLYVVGFKTYFNPQALNYFVFNGYLGIDYTVFNSKFDLSEKSIDPLKVSIHSTVKGSGVSLNLGGEMQFNSSGVRVAIINQEIKANGGAGEGELSYVLKNTELLLGIYLFH